MGSEPSAQCQANQKQTPSVERSEALDDRREDGEGRARREGRRDGRGRRLVEEGLLEREVPRPALGERAGPQVAQVQHDE